MKNATRTKSVQQLHDDIAALARFERAHLTAERERARADRRTERR
jgi:hypothetical protein